MSVTINISDNEMRKALKDIDKYSKNVRMMAQKEMVRTAYSINTQQKNKLRFHSGVSKKNYSAMISANSVDVTKASLGIVNIVNEHKAAVFFEEGTRRHIIRVKNKKVLATLSEYTGRIGGKSDKKGNKWTVFGREVNHPGTRPKPFFYHPVLKHSKTYPQRLKKILENA